MCSVYINVHVVFCIGTVKARRDEFEAFWGQV